MMQSITIPVDSEVQQAFEQASEAERQELGMLLSLFFKEGWAKKNIVETIANRTQERGVTPEILDEILTNRVPDLSINHNSELQTRLMAKLLQSKIAARPTGLCAGDFVVPEDFDQPLTDEILDAFEGK
jgi:hypothetical protein